MPTISVQKIMEKYKGIIAYYSSYQRYRKLAIKSKRCITTHKEISCSPSLLI